MTSEKRRWWVQVRSPTLLQYVWGPFYNSLSAHNFAKWLSFEMEAQVIFGVNTEAVYQNGIEPGEWLRFKRSCT